MFGVFRKSSLAWRFSKVSFKAVNASEFPRVYLFALVPMRTYGPKRGVHQRFEYLSRIETPSRAHRLYDIDTDTFQFVHHKFAGPDLLSTKHIHSCAALSGYKPTERGPMRDAKSNLLFYLNFSIQVRVSSPCDISAWNTASHCELFFLSCLTSHRLCRSE